MKNKLLLSCLLLVLMTSFNFIIAQSGISIDSSIYIFKTLQTDAGIKEGQVVTGAQKYYFTKFFGGTEQITLTNRNFGQNKVSKIQVLKLTQLDELVVVFQDSITGNQDSILSVIVSGLQTGEFYYLKLINECPMCITPPLIDLEVSSSMWCTSGTCFNTGSDCTTCTPNPSEPCQLVCNGGFEAGSTPLSLNQLKKACGWFSANASTPDYFKTNGGGIGGQNCAGLVDVPCNNQTYLQGMNGSSAYGGFIAKSIESGQVFAEYLSTKLNSNLVAGRNYTISFYIAKSKYNSPASNNIGILLTNNPLNITNYNVISNPNAIVNPSTITSTSWIQLSFNYTANGNEQYLTIGAFNNPTTTNVGCTIASEVCTFKSCPGACTIENNDPYYLVDEVSVLPSSTVTAVASPSAICNGNSTTLTATGLATYTWTPGNISGSSISVVPSITTTYTVSGTDVYGCVKTQTVTVNVNTTPIVSATSTSICSGGKAVLSASSSISGTTFLWSNGSTSPNISVSPSVTTTYTVTGTSNGCASIAVATVTVNATPTNTGFSVFPNSICQNSQSCFSAFQPNISGATYTFNDGNGNTINSSTGSNVCFTYPSQGTYYPSLAILQNGCKSTELNSVLTVTSPQVAINTNTAECGEVTFTAIPNSCIPSDAIYSWNMNGATQSSIGNPITIGGQSATSGFVNLTVTSVSGTVLYTSGNQFYAIPIQQQLCCGINKECVEEIIIPESTVENVPCTEETWSGTKTFTGVNTINNVAITVMPNTIIKIDAGATVNFGKCTFLMYDNSKILVNKNATQLKFNKCYLHGCNKLWEGISMEQTGGSLPVNPPIVIFTNSVIEDALVALDFSKNNDYVNLDIRYATFNKNITGIKLVNKPTAGTNGVYSPIRIREAVFSCKNFSLSMNPSFSVNAGSAMYNSILSLQPDAIPLPKIGTPILPVHQKSMTGIVLKGYLSSGNTYYGKTDQISPLETLIFDNLVQGISIIGLSMPEFKGHKFKNIKSPINGGYYDNYYGNVPAGVLYSGVSLHSTSGLTYTINKVGSSTPSAPLRNKFNDCYYGVYAKDEAIEVINNDFTDCYNGIYIGNANVPSTLNASVNSTIKNNQFLRLKYTGILLDKNLTINAEVIGNNINNSTGLNFTSRAIDIVEAATPVNAKYSVLNNVFNKTWCGARATLTNNTIFTNNTITLNTNTTLNVFGVNNAPYNTGIQLVSCEKPQVNENTIINGNQFNTWWEQGIVTTYSPNGSYYCNDVNGTFSSITTGGPCPGTFIYKNDFHNAKIAHWLIFSNVIGYQYNPTLSNAPQSSGLPPTFVQPADNRYYGINLPSLHSYSQNSTNAALDARFFIRGNNSVSPYAMLYNGYENPPFSTAITFPSITNNVYPYSQAGCAVNYPPNGRLMNVAKQIATDVLYPVNLINERFVSRKQLLSNLQKDNINNTGDTDIDNFASIMATENVGKLYNVEVLAQQGLDNADSTYYLQAEGINQSVVPADSIENLQKQVNEIYLQYLKKNGVFASQHIIILKSIAPLCPYRYGTSIWQARALLVGYDNTEYFNLCELYSAPEQINSNARMAQVIDEVRNDEVSSISVFPNPNNGSFNVELPISDEELTIEIINTVGANVKQFKHKSVEGNTLLNVKELTQGLYFVIVKQNGVIIGTNRVIVTN